MAEAWAASETLGATNGRSRYCLTCRTVSSDDRPPEWLWVVVNDASEPRGFRPFGLFCSTECLAAKLPEVASLLAEIDHLKAEIDRRPADVEHPDVSAVSADVARELLALSDIVGHLEALMPDARQRCARYLADRYRTSPAA